VTVVPPPDATPVPGTIVVPMPSPGAAPPIVAPGATGQQPPEAYAAPPSPPAAPDPVTTQGLGGAQVILSPPGTTFRINGGPYTVPISVTNVSRLSSVSLTVTFDPSLFRVRAVQEGSFMRSGGTNATFTQQVSPGRLDLAIVRVGDQTGASGTGLLAVLLIDAIGQGSASLTVNGAATGPGGTPMALQFRPVTIAVEP
jgi:hypothetical protein